MAAELTRRVFAAVDAFDLDTTLALLAPDATFVFGNAEPMIGEKEIGAGLDGFRHTVAGIRHEITREWYVDADSIIETQVFYQRLDGGMVSLPVVTIFRVDAENLIEDYRVFFDLAPVYAPANEMG